MDDLGASTPLVPPIYQSSVYRLPDLDALDRIMAGEEGGFIYARDGHPNARRLSQRLARIEGGEWAVVCGSGMASISALALALCQKDDRILSSNRLYGRTTQLFMQELPRFGVTTTLVDTNEVNQVEAALRGAGKGGFRFLFAETMSNPLLRVNDVSALVELARAYDCLLVIDNTFATPSLCRPLELGADLVMESLTKVIGGHSDVTLGVACGGKPRNETLAGLVEQVAQVVSIWGLASQPFDCWLAERSLDTLPLRMRTASHNAAALADWLDEQPSISRVVYPGRPDHPDHELTRRLFKQSGSEVLFGSMLCFELKGGREAVNQFLRKAEGIPFSPSLGNTTTTCSHPGSTSHRYVSPAEKKRQGISDGLVRLSVGIEDFEHIRREMARGFE